MVFEQKEFTPIKGYSAYYICKETTEVLSTKERQNTANNTVKILKQVNNSKNLNNNYFIVTLVDDNGKRTNRPIHRLMCETFLANPQNKAHVNHIDGNKLNNSLSNLEWATEQENAQHAVRTGLNTYEHFYREVHQYTISGHYVASYKSTKEAMCATGIQQANISKVALGKRKFTEGYQWSYNKVDHMDNLNMLIPSHFIVTDPTGNITTIKYPAHTALAKLLGCSRATITSKLKNSNTAVINSHTIELITFT